MPTIKLLLRRNVDNLGQIGDVVEVKGGYARNYLVPSGIAVVPTEANIRQVELDKERYLAELARRREELEAKAAVVDGKEVTIAARANEEGHLYGSIGPAQIAQALNEQGVFVEPEYIQIGEAIRRLDKYEVTARFGQDITATIHVWVVPVHGEAPPEPPAAQAPPQDEEAQTPSEDEAEQA